MNFFSYKIIKTLKIIIEVYVIGEPRGIFVDYFFLNKFVGNKKKM